jgi:hypothetical protein
MTTTLITTGLDVIFGTLSIATAIVSMMAIGAISEAISYARNPYLRQRRAKVMLNKMYYAFA